jgi:Zn finger protein HypA/HybF involved in hydrogenase expression
MKSYPGPPMTLGSAAAAHLRFEVWCKQCGHRSEPEPAEQARWYCPERMVPEWGRLVCGKCGSRDVGFVVSGSRRDPLF